jgi:ribonuclease-3
VRGPQHDPTFEVEVMIGSNVLGVGEGRSKRVAERAAALAALSTHQSATSPEDAPGPSAGEDENAPGSADESQ